MVPDSHEFGCSRNNRIFFLKQHSYLILYNNYKSTSTTINSLPKSYLTSECEQTPVQGEREDLSNNLQLRI